MLRTSYTLLFKPCIYNPTVYRCYVYQVYTVALFALLLLMQVYCSSEVTQHLPSEAYTFTTVDCEWRELMGTVARNTAVIAVCLKDGE